MLPPEFWTFAERYIALDTQPETGNAAVEDFALELLSPLAPRITLQRGVCLGKPQVNVLASFGPEADGGLLLVTHSDTVPAGPIARWSEGPPLALTRKGDRVVGLGVADVKLDYLCKAFALRSLDMKALRRPVHLLATYAEEVGLLGAKAFIAEKLLAPQWVLCGEPSELVPCHAHKGYAMTRLRAAVSGPLISASGVVSAEGKAAHSSTPHLGKNAILALCALLEGDAPIVSASGGSSSNTVPAEARAICDAACALPGPLKTGPDLRPALRAILAAWRAWTELAAALVPESDAEFSPAHVVCNFGLLQEEPGTLVASFDARLLPQHQPDELHAAFARKLAQLTPEGVALAASVERSAAGMRAAPTSALLRALARAVEAEGMPGAPKAKATSTEAGAFFQAGCDAAVFGPGVSVGNAHTANEWNRVRDLELATRIYARLIGDLCS